MTSTTTTIVVVVLVITNNITVNYDISTINYMLLLTSFCYLVDNRGFVVDILVVDIHYYYNHYYYYYKINVSKMFT